MKFAVVFSLLSSALVLAAPAPASDDAPAKLQKRLTCQLCSIGGIEAGPACCSAHCLIEYGNIHGGHCDENDYCICN
ncbi:hypothetical protein VTH82DRAFT_5317 [Thermothelomyces myriococcoides]